MRSGIEEEHWQVGLVAAAPAEIYELDRVGADSNSQHIVGFSLLLCSLPARLLIVAVAATLLWGGVVWALA
jgi:hypothetical protein